MERSVYESPLGTLHLAADEKGLCGLWMEGQKYFAAGLTGNETQNPQNPALRLACDWLDAYFAGKRPDVSALPLAPRGSEFRQQVWKLLCEIPYGEVTTYGELAKRLAAMQGRETMSAQAVGGAVGHNPISVIVPCHRVVGADGSLTGYAGGIQKKLWLLRHEGADRETLYLPTKGTAL